MTFTRRLAVWYGAYALAAVAFVLAVAWFEARFGAGGWIGYLFLFVTVLLYAVIGLLLRTSDLNEYYVAGRRVPAVFNGMASAADWLSAASFIGLAGSLYSTGYQALAYILGWTGGFCLLATLLAPYFRKSARLTVPDFLATRYASQTVRLIAVIATILCSFIYLVAQIEGVGMIAARFIGVDFSIGIAFGLAGVLVCSFMGGMRAVTWTQVAQYFVLISAVLVPVAMMGHQHGTRWLAHLDYGRVVSQVAQVEADLARLPGERAAHERRALAARALREKIDTLPASYHAERGALVARLAEARLENLPLVEIKRLEGALAALPQSPAEAALLWEREYAELRRLAIPPGQNAQDGPGAGPDAGSAWNFAALVFCLTVGTAALPHLLTRSATAPSVASARRAVGWTLFFVALFYLSVPVLAALVRYAVLTTVVGQPFAELAPWVGQWHALDPTLLTVTDLNHDHIVRLADLRMDPDMIMLAAPEIARLPYVISGLVAAGALAAALSTADGLLLTISNVLSHDIYYQLVERQASRQKRVTVAKIVLIGVALLAAWLAALKTADILLLVRAAFSLAASALFPVLVLAVFWKRMTRGGAIASMVMGMAVCLGYIAATHTFLAELPAPWPRGWFGIDSGNAGAFGVPLSFAAGIVVSLLGQAPIPETRAWVDRIRCP